MVNKSITKKRIILLIVLKNRYAVKSKLKNRVFLYRAQNLECYNTPIMATYTRVAIVGPKITFNGGSE